MAYQTDHGRMMHGLSDAILGSGELERFEKRVNLVFTSPPFPLNRKKRYGNKVGDEYMEWLSSYGPLLKRMLTSDGSIVMEIGNAWEQGAPVMSTLPIKSLLKFQEDNGFYLCQEFVWQNPAKLPSPVQWVNVERLRVKDNFTKVWWMSACEKAEGRQSTRFARVQQIYEGSAQEPAIQRRKAAFRAQHRQTVVPNEPRGELFREVC